MAVHDTPTIETGSVPHGAPEIQQRIVNDFSIQVATVNGSGSQTANNVLWAHARVRR